MTILYINIYVYNIYIENVFIAMSIYCKDQNNCQHILRQTDQI